MQKTIAIPLRYGEFGYSWGGCGGLPGVLLEDPDIPCRAVFQHINIDEFCFMLSGSSCATIWRMLYPTLSLVLLSLCLQCPWRPSLQHGTRITTCMLQ